MGMVKHTIKKITAQEILDSRGNPTVRATVLLTDGTTGVASVPSGASTGIHEAWELRDGGKRYHGKGVKKAIKHIETVIAKRLKGMDVTKQKDIDAAMCVLDGTENKKKLGANAILAVSLACARAGAAIQNKPLYKYIRQVYRLKEKGWRFPLPTMNVINGGRHANNSLSIQEFMIVPQHRSFAERVRIGSEVFHTLAKILDKKGYATAVGDEGGFAPNLKNNEAALKLLVQAIKEAGYKPGKHVSLAMDVAASEFHEDGLYAFDEGKKVDAKKIVHTLNQWIKKYPFVSIEDPLAEDDWDGWAMCTKKIGDKVAIVGDDLFVTNQERLAQGIEMDVANAILIKVNQIGTLSEAIASIQMAKAHGYQVSVSHRSGETADTFIADLAVAVNADYLKTGSLSRSERVEKYNRMMEIQQEVGA